MALNDYTWTPSYPLIKIPVFDTKIIDYNTGVEQRIKRRDTVKFRFKLNHNNITQDEAEGILDFFIQQRGAYTPFTFRDLSQSVSSLEIGAGDDSTTTFQLKHTFADVDKNAAVVSSVNVWNAGSLQSDPLHYTTNNSGVVTFVSAPDSGNAITASFFFDYVVRFAADEQNYEYFLHELFNQGTVELIEVL